MDVSTLTVSPNHISASLLVKQVTDLLPSSRAVVTSCRINSFQDGRKAEVHGWCILPYVRPSKLGTCLNDDGCFEGVPSLATVLASFEAWGIATRHRHAFAK